MEDKISITKSKLHQNWKQRLEGENLTDTSVKFGDADYFFREDSDMDPETPIYEVVLNKSSKEDGHLNWGYICVYPGRVDDQYFCTRGHFNSNPKAEEYLLCMQGDGLIMYLDREGNCWCEMLEEGSLHHVEEGLAFRLINLGDEELLLSFCRQSNSEADMTAEFPCHVYEDNGEMAIFVDIKDEPLSDDSENTFEDILFG